MGKAGQGRRMGAGTVSRPECRVAPAFSHDLLLGNTLGISSMAQIVHPCFDRGCVCSFLAMIASIPPKPKRSTKVQSAKAHTVVIIDDHPMIREHLGHLLVRQLKLNVCGEAANTRDGLELIERTGPDLAIIDVKLPGPCGLELVKDIVTRKLKTRTLVLSMHDEELYAERAFKAGANGYITKENVSSEIVEAIRQVMNGNLYYSSGVREKLHGKVEHFGGKDLESLTDRELEVFQMLGHGKNTREIATELGLGASTVETYRSRIKGKLKIRNAAELYQRTGLWVQENGG